MEQQVKITIEGVCPLVMHNGRLADPLDEWAKRMKAVSSKRNKTDADIEELARLEFMGGLYYDEKNGIYIPADMIEACFINGAKKSKRGPQAKSGFFLDEDAKFEYKGPKKPDELWQNKDFVLKAKVRIMANSVMRYRPHFPKWKATFTALFFDDILSKPEIKEILETAGRIVGLGDWRPKYGRFKVTKF